MIGKGRFIAVNLLLLITLLYTRLHSDTAVPMKRAFHEFPLKRQGWTAVSHSLFSEEVLKVLRPTDYLAREYAGQDGSRVSLYIGYHDGGRGGGGIHSPRHCLPGSGWYRLEERELVLEAGGKSLRVVSAVYQKGEGKERFLYWYQVKGRSITDEYALKGWEVLNSLLYRRRDSAFVRVSLPFDADGERALSAALRFVRDFHPVIDEFLPR
ncbi:MAG: EpsI family protein [Nitrospirales bacterium]|nr:EpsI family protein [Nitrospirales bacterium]